MNFQWYPVGIEITDLWRDLLWTPVLPNFQKTCKCQHGQSLSVSPSIQIFLHPVFHGVLISFPVWSPHQFQTVRLTVLKLFLLLCKATASVLFWNNERKLQGKQPTLRPNMGAILNNNAIVILEFSSQNLMPGYCNLQTNPFTS